MFSVCSLFLPTLSWVGLTNSRVFFQSHSVVILHSTNNQEAIKHQIAFNKPSLRVFSSQFQASKLWKISKENQSRGSDAECHRWLSSQGTLEQYL